MFLLTLDEARSTVARSALRLLERCDTTAPAVLAALLAGDVTLPVSAHDQGLARRHRRILDHVTTLGYRHEADDELDGINSLVDITGTLHTTSLEEPGSWDR